MIPIAKPEIGPREKAAVQEVLDSGMLVQGPRTRELEKRFAELCGTKEAIAVNNGTAAIHTALYALGIDPGDEVITTPFTFVASANPVLMQGATLRFVDIEPESYTIDPAAVEKAITEKTKAIIAIDLYGQPAKYEELGTIAKKHGIKIIEDACQAHSASIGEQKAGALGDLGCFSFYATKNMMCGEGGMITTDNTEWAERCRRFRHHGQSEQTRYEYHDLGYNYRLTDLQAAIALVQLDRIEEMTAQRIKNATLLNEGLKEIEGITTPSVQEGHTHVYHQYTIRCDNKLVQRDKLLAHLKEQGIGAAVYYPKPLHFHPHFARLGYKEGDFPEAERAAKEVLSLPVQPSVSEEEIGKITKTIREFMEAKR